MTSTISSLGVSECTIKLVKLQMKWLKRNQLRPDKTTVHHLMEQRVHSAAAMCQNTAGRHLTEGDVAAVASQLQQQNTCVCGRMPEGSGWFLTQTVLKDILLAEATVVSLCPDLSVLPSLHYGSDASSFPLYLRLPASSQAEMLPTRGECLYERKHAD